MIYYLRKLYIVTKGEVYVKSKFYKVIAVIIAILGGVGGIYLGSIFGDFYSGFNAGIMISCWVGVVILCLIFYGIASALEYLEELGAGQDEEQENNIVVRNEKPVVKNTAKTTDNNMWECPNCHSKNQYSNNPECPKCHWQP